MTALFNSQAFNTYHLFFIPLNANNSQSLEDFEESFWSSEKCRFWVVSKDIAWT